MLDWKRREDGIHVLPICRELVRLVNYSVKHVDLLLKINTMSLGLKGCMFSINLKSYEG